MKKLFLILIFSGQLTAATLNVPGEFSTIQKGIIAATDGDTILVQPGVYKEYLAFLGKKIVVTSTFIHSNDPKTIENTIIDGSRVWTVVSFLHKETRECELSGFTIRDGFVYTPDTKDPYFNVGGGIFCDTYSSPVLKNLVIKENTAWLNGGGIYCNAFANPLLENVKIDSNLAYYAGGGIYCDYRSNPELINVTISNNLADYAAGMYCNLDADAILRNTVIHNNKAVSNGGGFQCFYSSPKLFNVTIADNQADRGGGIYLSDGAHPVLFNTILANNSPNEIQYSIFTGTLCNITLAYCNIKGGMQKIVFNEQAKINWLEGNIETDPWFMRTLNSNYELQPNSPCIDAGTALAILDNDTLFQYTVDRFNGSAPDIGAFESAYTTGIIENTRTPQYFKVFPNYPNPFNGATFLTYSIKKTAYVKLDIYNALGKIVESFIPGTKTPGVYKFHWQPEALANGIYIARFNINNQVFIQKMILLQ